MQKVTVADSFQRVLVFQTAFLGDAILAIPLLKELRKIFPRSSLGFVCRQGLGEFFLSTGLVDRTFEVDKQEKSSLRKAMAETLEFKPDLVVSPHRSLRTALWVWKLKPQMSVGFRDPWTFFAYQKRIPRPAEKHDVLRQLSLLRPWQGGTVTSKTSGSQGSASHEAGVSAGFTSGLSLKVQLPCEEKFGAADGAVALAPGSQWATKRWTEEGFMSLAQNYRARGWPVVLVGARSEQKFCDEIQKRVPGVINFCGQTSILELAQVLKRCRLLVCNDSGAMHVATAVGTPVAAVFGPTIPSQGYAPWGDKTKIVEVTLSCRPCGAHGHDQCPIGTHDCMKKISPEDVMTSADGLLS